MNRSLALIGLLLASTCWAQDPVASPPHSISQAEEPAPAAAQGQTIVIPAGTRIPLSLASPLTTKSARPGKPVRAVTGFPVTVGTQVAIPAGAYVEGIIDNVTKAPGSAHGLRMRFSRILYPNGYSVPVDGVNLQAHALRPDLISTESATYSSAAVAASTSGLKLSNSLADPQVQNPPPFPKVGPSIGLVAGIATGVTAAVIVLLLLLGHHQHVGDAVLFDTGWQFDMVLQSPVTVSAMSVAGAAAPVSAQ